MHDCTLKTLYGAIQAQHQIDQGPIFDKKLIETASLEAQLSFAKVMNNFTGRQVKGAVDIEKYTRDEGVAGVLDRGINLGRTAEALLPEKVYAKIDKKMEQFATVYRKEYFPKFQALEAKYVKLMEGAKGNQEALKALDAKHQNELAPIRKQAEKYYRENLAGQFKSAKEQLQSVFDQHAGNPEKLQSKLKTLGLNQADAYYTHEYLKYLENGGPFFNFNRGSGSKVADYINQRISTITGKKVSFNPMTAIYNVGEMAQKAPAVFGAKNTIAGINDALSAATKAKVTIFDEIPQLKKEGIYSNDFSPLRPGGKFDPVSKTQNLLDNAAYFIGKRSGDVQKGLKEIAFRPKPWNDTFIYNDPSARNMLNFMSFQFRHMQQYGGWVRDIISPAVASKQKAASAKALATYALMSGVIFGDKAAIPAPIYHLLKGADPELDKQLDQFGIFKKGVVGLVSDGNVDLGKYAQPLGGVALGIGTEMVSNAEEALTKTYPQVAKQAHQGRPDKAAALAVNGLVKFSQLFKIGANALVQKSVDGALKAYLDDEDFEGYARNVGQKLLGKDAISNKPKPTPEDSDLNLDLNIALP